MTQFAGAKPGRSTRPLGLLIVEQPPSLRGQALPVPAPSAVVGREGDVRLNSPQVSRRHASIWQADGQVWVRDEDSANGTFVGDVRVSGPRRLRDDDRVRFGDVVAVFSTRDVPLPRSAPAGHAMEPDTESEPGPEPEPESWQAQTETTRFLSAATHLDRRYRAIVLDATVRETFRAVCPSYGVDLSVVARHAVVAERRAILRDAVLTVVLLLAIGLAAAGAASFEAMVFLIAVALFAVTVTTAAKLSTLGRLLRRGCKPADLPMPAGRVAGVLHRLADVNRGNVGVFTIFDPFVGSGFVVDAGSFTVSLIPQQAPSDPDKPDTKTTLRPTTPLRSGEVIDALNTSLRALRVPHLRVDTRLYVNGYDVALFRELLPDPRLRPRPIASKSLLREAIEQPASSARPYLCAEFTAWKGQLVVTTFIRVVTLPGVLYVESAAYVLPPLKSSYYKVDQMRIRSSGERISSTLGATARDFIPALLTSPYHLTAAVNRIWDAAQRERLHRRRVADRVLVDYGAVTSVREQASDDNYGYFMSQDTDMFVKVVQQKVVDAIYDLLEQRGYETDKIKQIQNSTNISVTGGNIGSIGAHSKGEVSLAREPGQSSKDGHGNRASQAAPQGQRR
jgi:FHA domain